MLPGHPSEDRCLGKSSDLGSDFGEHLSSLSHSKSTATTSEEMLDSNIVSICLFIHICSEK